MIRRIWVFVLGICTYTVMVQQAPASEMSILNMQGMSVKADHELPNSLAIVPWNQAEVFEQSPYEVSDLLDENLQAVDSVIFENDVELYRSMQSK